MKLKMDTPMASAPIVAAELSRCPATAELTMPIRGTVMLEMMFGTANRRISRFMSWFLMCKYTAFADKGKYFGTVFRSDSRRDNPLFPENSGCRCRYPENSITFAACTGVFGRCECRGFPVMQGKSSEIADLGPGVVKRRSVSFAGSIDDCDFREYDLLNSQNSQNRL